MFCCRCIVLPVLKNYYARLFHALTKDYVKTINKLKQLIPGVLVDHLEQLRATLPSADLINETIVGILFCGIKAENDVLALCDVMERLYDEIHAKNMIKSFRNGKLAIDA